MCIRVHLASNLDVQIKYEGIRSDPIGKTKAICLESTMARSHATGTENLARYMRCLIRMSRQARPWACTWGDTATRKPPTLQASHPETSDGTTRNSGVASPNRTCMVMI